MENNEYNEELENVPSVDVPLLVGLLLTYSSFLAFLFSFSAYYITLK